MPTRHIFRKLPTVTSTRVQGELTPHTIQYLKTASLAEQREIAARKLDLTSWPHVRRPRAELAAAASLVRFRRSTIAAVPRF
ncbi:hypothetical protein EVAR_479_1 [Eumeta japonica]|uniref:Uncharacterized protein n=1 Tax=Eumeta variegata TaxID=151549 RepID=A0A4C1SAE8_EUMVA|nr:hypothetical protein EVAR_479_1 [Eumeta japonica]